MREKNFKEKGVKKKGAGSLRPHNSCDPTTHVIMIQMTISQLKPLTRQNTVAALGRGKSRQCSRH